MAYSHELALILAEAVVFVHVLWCAWILLGWTVTRGRRVLRSLHIISIAYAIVIELIPWSICPLTLAENWLETQAGIQPARGPFLIRVLDAIVYPDLPAWLVVGGAVTFCLLILAIYVRRYLHRDLADLVNPSVSNATDLSRLRMRRDGPQGILDPRKLRSLPERTSWWSKRLLKLSDRRQ